MLSLPVQKDIGEYQEKLVAGLSATSLGALAVGVACAAAVVFLGLFVLHLPEDPIYMIAAAFVVAAFAVGFVKPLGLPMLQAAPILWRTYMGKTQLTYSTSAALAQQAEKKMQSKEKGSTQDVRAKEGITSEYADERAERGAASPEWVLPRVHYPVDLGQ